MKHSNISRMLKGWGLALALAGAAGSAQAVGVTTLYVDNAADFTITTDQGAPGLDAGDTVTWDPGTGSPVAGLTFGTDAFDSIQSAIDAAAAGTTIEVAPGTYDELLIVSKSVNLRGANAGIHPAVGANTTEVVGTRGAETMLSHAGFYAISPRAHDITIDGFKFTSSSGSRTIDSSGEDYNNLHIVNNIFANTATAGSSGVIQLVGGDHDGIVIDFNLFTHTGDGSSIHTGGAAGSGSFTNMRVANNHFDSESDGLRWFTDIPMVDGVIEQNEFSNGGNGFDVGKANNIAIAGNYFHDMESAGFSVGANGGSITGNRFERIDSAAFLLWGGEWGTFVSSNVSIENNFISYNDIVGNTDATYGIVLDDLGDPGDIDASTINININSIVNGGVVGAGTFSVVHLGDPGTDLDAGGNWWGTTDAATIAASISGSVDFTPFLNSGTDTDGGTVGFQGDFSTVNVTLLGAQAGATGRIQEAVNAVASGGTVNVAAGTYVEFVDIGASNSEAKAGLTLQAVGNAIIQPSSGSGDIIEVRDAGVTIDGFTLIGMGATGGGVDGIVFQGVAGSDPGTVTNNTIQDVELGIALFHDNSGWTITGNTIQDARKAIAMGSGDDGLIQANTISGSTQIGIELFKSAEIRNNNITDNTTGIWIGSAADASQVTIHDNSIESNTLALDNTAAGIVDASGNWWGTTDEATIAASISGSADFTPFLNSGTDTDGGTAGFQGDFSTLNVTALGEQVGATPRIAEGIAGVDLAGLVSVNAGTYTENVDVNRAIDVQGTPTVSGTLTVSAAGAELAPGFSKGVIASGDLDLQAGTALNLEVNGDTAGTGHDQVVVTGTVNLAGDLNLSGSVTTDPGQEIVLIANDGTDAITGAFATPHAEGAEITINSVTFFLTYIGGDGNDVTLTEPADAPVEVAATGGDDIIEVRRSGDNIQVLVGGTIVSSRPIDSLAQGFTIEGGSGADTFTVDLSGGNVAVPITFNGGDPTTNPGDTLVIQGGGSFANVTHTFTSASSGSIDVTGSATIGYTGFEPVTDNLDAASRVFDFTGGAETITLSDDGTAGNSVSLIDSTLGESVTFTNPTASLEIKTTADVNADTIEIQGVDAMFDADLTVTGKGADTTEFETNSTDIGSGELDVTSGAGISISQNITTGADQIYHSPIALPGDSILETTGIGNIAINAGISGAGNLTLKPNPGQQAAFANGTTSTISGNIVLASGISRLVGSAAISDGTGTVTVQSGATLEGRGNVAKQVDLQSGGAVAPGGRGLVWNQDFSTDTEGWEDSDDGWRGQVTFSGDGTAQVEGDGVSAPFSRFDGYRDVFPGTWVAEIDIFLDPGALAAGEGFDYTVEANGTDGKHEKDFIFHVTKDTSTGKLLVAASNNTNFAPREDLDTLPNHHEVTVAGWYTLQHVFRDDGGVLVVDMNLVAADGTIDFTETQINLAETIPDVVGGNRIAWFTFISVAGGISVDNHQLFIGPPTGVGILSTGNLNLSSGGNVNMEINGKAVAGTDFDQINVTGTVSLNGATLNLSGDGFTRAPGDEVILIDNDGTADAVTGIFNGLPEGTKIDLPTTGDDVFITYEGGDGNDVALVFYEVEVTVAPASRNEDSGNTLVYTFSRAPANGSALTVDFTVGGTAVAGTTGIATLADGDYTHSGAMSLTDAAGQVVIAAGSASTDVVVTPTADNLVELPETLKFTVQNGTVYLAGADDEAEGTILNDDSAEITIANVANVREGHTGDNPTRTFTVSISNPVDTDVTVRADTADGTATVADTDYQAVVNQTVTFSAGDGTAQTVTVTINGDDTEEGVGFAVEDFFVDLSNLAFGGRSVSVPDDQGQSGIINDDFNVNLTATTDPDPTEGTPSEAFDVDYTVGSNWPGAAGGVPDVGTLTLSDSATDFAADNTLPIVANGSVSKSLTTIGNHTLTLAYTGAVNGSGDQFLDASINESHDVNNKPFIDLTPQPLLASDPDIESIHFFVQQEAGPQAFNIADFIISETPGLNEKAVQNLTLTIANDNNGLFDVQPAITAPTTINTGGYPALSDLTFTVAPNVNGRATVTITATDDGAGMNFTNKSFHIDVMFQKFDPGELLVVDRGAHIKTGRVMGLKTDGAVQKIFTTRIVSGYSAAFTFDGNYLVADYSFTARAVEFAGGLLLVDRLSGDVTREEDNSVLSVPVAIVEADHSDPAKRDHFYVGDAGADPGSIYDFDLNTGGITLLSRPGPGGLGAGPTWAYPFGMVRDGTDLYVTASSEGSATPSSIVKVDTTTGDRTTVVTLTTANRPVGIDIDRMNDLLVYCDVGSSNVNTVPLATVGGGPGDVTTVSGFSNYIFSVDYKGVATIFPPTHPVVRTNLADVLEYVVSASPPAGAHLKPEHRHLWTIDLNAVDFQDNVTPWSEDGFLDQPRGLRLIPQPFDP